MRARCLVQQMWAAVVCAAAVPRVFCVLTHCSTEPIDLFKVVACTDGECDAHHARVLQHVPQRLRWAAHMQGLADALPAAPVSAEPVWLISVVGLYRLVIGMQPMLFR